MPIKKLGEVLSSTQSVVTATSLDKSVKETSQIPKGFEIDTSMMFAGLATSSVKILLKKENNTFINNEKDILDESFDKFKNIVESGDDTHLINKNIENMSEKVMINYRDFLDVLDKNNIGVEFFDPLIDKPNKKIFGISSKKAHRIHEKVISKEKEIKNTRISETIRAIDLDVLKFKIKLEKKKNAIPINFEEYMIDEVSENKVNSVVTIDISDEITKTNFKKTPKHIRNLKRFIKK